MKCQKCLEIDHPHGANFCHACGEPLRQSATHKIAKHLRWYNTGFSHPKGQQRAKPAKYGSCLTAIDKTKTAWQRLIGNRSPQWLFERTCKALRVRPRRWLAGMNWSQALRYLLLAAIFVENLVLSIIEYPLEEPWGQVTIFMVNVTTLILTTCTCVSSNLYDLYDNRSTFWRLYYNWLHFIWAAATPILGYMVVCAFQNFLTLTIDFLLSGAVLLMDSGTMETLTDNR